MRTSRIAHRQHCRMTCETLRYRPRSAALVVLVSALCLTWLILKLILSVSWRGRWYWNYVVSYHPALAHLLPSGRWGPIDAPPRFMDEVLNAPWMGEWDVPTLSAPSYHRSDTSQSGRLSSPALLKLHIFSTPTITAQSKRDVIRSVSPMLNLPRQFRHLVDIKFVLGYPLNRKGDIERSLEDRIRAEQSIHRDLFRLEGLKDGENIRQGKILDWMRAVGTRLDGGREALWVFKMDDDVRKGIDRLQADVLDGDQSAKLPRRAAHPRPAKTRLRRDLAQPVPSVSLSLHRHAHRFQLGVW